MRVRIDHEIPRKRHDVGADQFAIDDIARHFGDAGLSWAIGVRARDNRLCARDVMAITPERRPTELEEAAATGVILRVIFGEAVCELLGRHVFLDRNKTLNGLDALRAGGHGFHVLVEIEHTLRLEAGHPVELVPER